MYYALFKAGGYKWYEELLDLLPLEWNCYEEKGYYDGSDPNDKGRRLDIQTLGMISDSRFAENQYEGHYGYIDNKTISDEDLSSLETMLRSHVNDMRKKLGETYIGSSSSDSANLFKGLFFDAFFVHYAYRLYDDTNIKLSPPILIMPSYSLLKSMSITSSWGFVPYAGSGHVGYGFWANLGKMFLSGYVPGLKYDLSSLSGYKDIIKGVDIFMSPMLNITGIDRITDLVRLFPFTFPGFIDVSVAINEMVTVTLLKEIDLKIIEEMSSFYLVKSLDLGDTTGGQYVPFPAKTDTETIGNINSLVHKEQLADDTLSVHTTGARKSYMYNKRLHLADIRTTYFGGYIFPFFKWGEGFEAKYNGGPAFTYASPSWDTGELFVIETEIDRGSYSGKVYATYEMVDWHFGVLSAMLSYPDASAKRMTFYRKEQQTGETYRIASFALTPHEFLNLSYYLEEGLDHIYISPSGDLLPSGLDLPEGAVLEAHNELRVSETDNPLRITNSNIIQVGTGRIMAMGSNVMNVSNWNYGTYPLYVFSDEGVYSLRTGEGDVAYSAVIQPACLEAPVSGVICQTPQGVVFAISRGLCIINGSMVNFLSGAIEEDSARLHFQTAPAYMDGVWLNYGMESFREYLEGLTGMLYDHYRNELIIMNNSKGYNWVLSFDDGSFYMISERVEAVVKNSLPDLRVVSGRKLLDFSREAGDAHVSFITRPLLYGTHDVKMMERILMRATVYELKKMNGKAPVVVLYYSNDGRNFRAATGLSVKEGNHKDLDPGLRGRTKFRQYIFSFSGVCGQETALEFLESEIVNEYDNTKMR
jgi:hypothetical protein